MEKSSNAEITPWGRKVPVLVDDEGSTHLVDQATGTVELVTTAPVAPPAFEKTAATKRGLSRWWALVALVALVALGALVASRGGAPRAAELAAAAPKAVKKASKAPKVLKAPKSAKKL